MTEEPLRPAMRDVISGLVEAVRAGDDARIDHLLDEFIRVATPGALYELRRQLVKGVSP
ncbi:hypothetical protein ACFU51_07575 [Streptomyces sp. NPDC057430]|uniref:hypothetical protein n=1 Tax=Streptomyces sp. NPDC057430 TaxID=3346131 RepID=UPI00368292FE